MPDERGQAPPESEISSRLVARIASGDRDAESEMYLRYARPVIRILQRRGAETEEAEDICHDTFVTACAKLRTGEDEEDEPAIRNHQSLASFLQGIAIRKLAGKRRKAARRETYADTDAIERAIAEVGSPFDDTAAAQLSQALRRALADLSTERDRDILESVYLRDEDRSSIQQRLGLDAAHFDRVLYRAKKRLAAEITGRLAGKSAEVSDLREFAAKRHY